MKYQCDKGHIFIQPAKRVENEFNGLNHEDAEIIEFIHPGDKSVVSSITFDICPLCGSLEISEAVENTVANVESVYIYELTSGPQTALDGLLAQGYVITNRYAKAYHLEKPKATPQQSEDKFTEDAKIYYSKLHPGETTQ